MLKLKALVIVLGYFGLIAMLCQPGLAHENHGFENAPVSAHEFAPAPAPDSRADPIVHEAEIKGLSQEILRIEHEGGDEVWLQLESQEHLGLKVFVFDSDRRLLGRIRGETDARMRLPATADDRYFIVIRNRSFKSGNYRLVIR